MSLQDFRAALHRAVRVDSPGHLSAEEAAALVTLARATSGPDRTTVDRELEALQASARRRELTMDASTFEALDAFLHGGGFLGAPPPRPAPVPAPTAPAPSVPPPSPGGPPATSPVSSLQGTELAPYGQRVQRVGVPAVLARPNSPVVRALWDFGAGMGSHGTGFHIGNGYLLTAAHVINAWRSGSTLPPQQQWVGRESMDPYMAGWSIRLIPAGGSFTGGVRVSHLPSDLGGWNDWVLVQAPSMSGRPALPLRRTSSLQPGENVWIVGDVTGTRTRISAGSFGGASGNNATLVDCEVESGFSGSPAVDAQGNVVGIAVSAGPSHCNLVTTDAILDAFAEGRRVDPTLP